MFDFGHTWRRGFLAIIVGACLFAGSCERRAEPQRDGRKEPPAEESPAEKTPAGEAEQGTPARPEPDVVEKAPPPAGRPVTPPSVPPPPAARSVVPVPPPPAAADYIWIEGERPASENFASGKNGWGNKHYLSEEGWLNLSIGGNEVRKKVPAGGIVIAYRFTAPSAGRYEVWNRIGYEFVRSPFEWRLDLRAWNEVSPEELTTDLMEIGVWCEVAWIRMGRAELAAGGHTLQIRHTAREKDGKPQRILYASDALCIYKGRFRPNGRHKPGEDWREDADREAARTVYDVQPGGERGERGERGSRIETPLSGPWEIARYDEQMVEDRTGPTREVASQDLLYWRGIKVPGDRNGLRPEMVFCHRYVYRTRVKVPAELGGRSFFLHFPSVNMIASVIVNGVYCGYTKAPFAVWDCDITKALRAGEVNEIVVAIKDTYYGLAYAKRDDGNTRYNFNIPPEILDSNQGTGHLFDFPVWHHRQNGILEPPSLVACGRTYTADVFAMPSVRNKELGLEITLKNPGTAAAAVKIECEVVPLAGGPPEMTFAPSSLAVPAGGEEVVRIAEGWPNPRLWWPDDPQQYVVVTKVSIDGEVVDIRRTKFGFREWTWDGPRFVLNGVPWQGRADLTHHGTSDPEAAVRTWREHGQTMFRFWATGWGGMTQGETLDFMDANGVPVRRSGIFDGEMASYGLTEGRGKDRRARTSLFDNWLHRCRAWVRGERNHPSVFVWSLENEITYINSKNLGQAGWVEPEMTRVAREIMKLDPTRPVMVDGGRALTDMSLPVNGCHYNEKAQRDYPDEAYTLERAYRGKHRGQWPMKPDAPVFMGESFYARGYNSAGYAGIGGESAFLGRSETRRPVGLYAKMLSEGYRWHGVAAFHYWFSRGDGDLHYNSWQPVCVLCREWNWTFGGGTKVPRTLKVLNDTRHTDPIEMAWRLEVDGRVVQKGGKTFRIGPGLDEETVITLDVPKVRRRTPGRFILTCSRGGREVFREVKDVWIIDADGARSPVAAAGELAVFDPQGQVKARLTRRGVRFTEVASFDAIPGDAKVIVVGRDALTARQATDPKWRRLAASGARVLVLDQKTPLHFQAVPADFELTDHVGRIAFSENLEHPVFDGLDQPDFFTWSKDHIVYRNVYRKASKGARSLAQCDRELSCSAIVECPVSEGLLLLCQMVVGGKLDTDPVAQKLFDNMLNYCFDYEVVRKATASTLRPSAPEGRMIASIGLKYDRAADVLSAFEGGRHEIVIADADPGNLRKLAGGLGRLKAFTARGGWLVLWGLGPEGLADFNRVVGVEHLIRPFEMERVTMPAVRDPILSGLTVRDVVMESGQKIQRHAGDKFLADDVFTYVVDIDNIAPFCTIPGPEHWDQAGAKPGFDHWPRNMVNGFVTSDSWKYIFSILLSRGETTKWTMTLPREEEVTEFSIALNAIYHSVTKVKLVFDGDEARGVVLETRPGGERQDFAIRPARRAKSIAVELLEWDKVGRQDVVGVDNIWIRVKRSAEFRKRVKPLLNVGALMKYPMGKGGVVLIQIRAMETESVPINAQKKKTILGALLRNLGAVFEGRADASAGNLRYEPVLFGDRYNQYLTNDRGWFDNRRDLAHLPVGEQRFAGVSYGLLDFRTSPVPSCVMLAGRGVKGNMPREVKGLNVGRKADALFFLHAFKRTREWRPRRRARETPPAVCVYVVNYADGGKVEVPVRYGVHVDHWITKDPKGLRGASLAWAAPFPNDSSGEQAALFQMSWVNPRPEVEIRSIDMKYDDKVGGRWGVPVLVGLSAGSRSTQRLSTGGVK